jgi:hypothetical protein
MVVLSNLVLLSIVGVAAIGFFLTLNHKPGRIWASSSQLWRAIYIKIQTRVFKFQNREDTCWNQHVI